MKEKFIELKSKIYNTLYMYRYNEIGQSRNSAWNPGEQGFMYPDYVKTFDKMYMAYFTLDAITNQLTTLSLIQ